MIKKSYWSLLATSPDKEGIIKCISNFFYSKTIEVHDDGTVSRAVANGTTEGKQTIINGVRVVIKKNRYRFEMFVQ